MTEQDNHSCEVYHFDLYGTREEKYRYLQTHNLNDVEWQQLTPQAPSFFFVPKDFSLQQEYEQGFKIDELMKVNVSGIKTQRDDASVFLSEKEMLAMRNDFLTLSVDELKSKYGFKDVRDWQVQAAKEDIQKNPILADKLCYRPFDIRPMLYTGKTKGIQGYPRYDKMRHLLYGYYRDTEGIVNIGLLVPRQCENDWHYVFISNNICDINYTGTAGKLGAGNVFPLYLYPEEGSIDTSRRPNLDEKIWAQINTTVGKDTTPEDIFDYIYGVLHSPAYRAKYKEFLKVDFPRIPYPKDQAEFEHFRSFGNRLRELHLMHNVPESPVTFPNAGSMQVDALRWEWNKDDGYSGNVYINETQCFEGVPAEAWDFYIGGYQPAQKWLKDRKGRTLSFDDIEHYRKIISVLMETSRLMKEIG